MQQNTTDILGGVVKSARQAKGFTQCQLAERLEITLRHLKAIENSGQKPSYDLLARSEAGRRVWPAGDRKFIDARQKKYALVSELFCAHLTVQPQSSLSI